MDIPICAQKWDTAEICHWDTAAVELLSQDNPKTLAFPSSGHRYQWEPLSWRHTQDAWRHLEIHSTLVAWEKRSISPAFSRRVWDILAHDLNKYKMGRRTGGP